jgi:hypothetical protein
MLDSYSDQFDRRIDSIGRRDWLDFGQSSQRSGPLGS